MSGPTRPGFTSDAAVLSQLAATFRAVAADTIAPAAAGVSAAHDLHLDPYAWGPAGQHSLGLKSVLNQVGIATYTSLRTVADAVASTADGLARTAAAYEANEDGTSVLLHAVIGRTDEVQP